METQTINQFFSAFLIAAVFFILFRFMMRYSLYSELEQKSILKQFSRLSERYRNEDD